MAWLNPELNSQCDLFLHMNGPSFKLVMFQKVLFSSQKGIVLKLGA